MTRHADPATSVALEAAGTAPAPGPLAPLAEQGLAGQLPPHSPKPVKELVVGRGQGAPKQSCATTSDSGNLGRRTCSESCVGTPRGTKRAGLCRASPHEVREVLGTELFGVRRCRLSTVTTGTLQDCVAKRCAIVANLDSCWPIIQRIAIWELVRKPL